MSKPVQQIVDEEVAARRDKLQSLEAEIMGMRQEMDQVQQELSVLMSLQRKIADASNNESTTTTVTPEMPRRKLTPSAAVIALLTREGKATKQKIVNELENRITSKSKHKRRLLIQTIINLTKKGRIKQDGDEFHAVNGKK